MRVNDADHALLDAKWHQAFDALRAAGLEADAHHPIAASYRAASNAVNHANRSRDWAIATDHPRSPANAGETIPTPECPAGHGAMNARPLERQTPEQIWCGEWFDCSRHGCTNSFLIPSPALTASLASSDD